MSNFGRSRRRRAGDQPSRSGSDPSLSGVAPGARLLSEVVASPTMTLTSVPRISTALSMAPRYPVHACVSAADLISPPAPRCWICSRAAGAWLVMVSSSTGVLGRCWARVKYHRRRRCDQADARQRRADGRLAITNISRNIDVIDERYVVSQEAVRSPRRVVPRGPVERLRSRSRWEFLLRSSTLARSRLRCERQPRPAERVGRQPLRGSGRGGCVESHASDHVLTSITRVSPHRARAIGPSPV